MPTGTSAHASNFSSKALVTDAGAHAGLLWEQLDLGSDLDLDLDFDSDWSGAAGGECGTRGLMPQMQFDLLIYRILGVLKSSYARCHMAGSLRDSVGLLRVAADTRKVMTDEEDATLEVVHQKRTAAAGTIITAWMFVTLATLMTFTWGACASSSKAAKGRIAAHKVSLFSWANLSWLDDILSACRHAGQDLGSEAPSHPDSERRFLEAFVQAGADTTPSPEAFMHSGAGPPDLERHSHEAFMHAWRAELATRGEKASLSRAVQAFLGLGTILRIFSAAVLSALMEFVGLPIALDLLLSSLHLATEQRARLPWHSHDLLGPALATVILGFAVPLAGRYANAMLSLSDGYHSQRIIAGLLAATYEKCLRLSAAGGRGRGGADPISLVNNDIIKMATGALKVSAHAVVAPLCMLLLGGLLIRRLGHAALLSAAAIFCLFLLNIPVRDLARQWNERWLQDLDARVGLLRETTCNACAIQATSRQAETGDRLLALRERELKSRFGYVLVQSLLNVPLYTFPYALVAITLGLRYGMAGEITISEIFVCMQTLSGLAACTASLIAATQRTVLLPTSCRRIERFLMQPENSATAVRQPARHPDAAHVNVKGSFAFEADAQPVLRDLDFSAKRGELVAVVGTTASGKSAFLSTMLGQMASSSEGCLVEAPKHVAYCSQTPWLTEGGIEANVTLGDFTDVPRYQAALSAAAIEDVGDSAQEQANCGASQDSTIPKPRFPYFVLWNIFTVTAFCLSVLNVKWDSTPFMVGVLVVLTQAVLHWSVLEIPLQTLATFFCKNERQLNRADGSTLTIALNYNLLATCEADVDGLMVNMHEAYWHNLAENVSAVLVSATNDPELKEYEFVVRDQYREKIFNELQREGRAWAGAEKGDVHPGHAKRIWSKYAQLDMQDFLEQHLDAICRRFADDFMLLQRVSRVLKKCGQYQDLMLLSSGDAYAFTYTDPGLYGPMRRRKDEPLFHSSPDVDRVCGRSYDYTLVLDADTRVEPGSVFTLLDIAAAYPHRSLIQPAIKMDVAPKDSLFMHLEGMRQTINEPMNRALTQILGKSGFFGKGLIKNSAYIEKCLGTRERLIETVPIDVLSHDTFEAAVLEPMYAGDVHLLEAPCGSYVTWDIRERRWNRGELLLGMYFFPRLIGDPFRWIQSRLQGKRHFSPQMRTDPNLDEVSSYIAHAAIRQMALKPALVSYIVLVDFVNMHYMWTPILTVMFLIIVFPKIATCTTDNCKACLLETVASILQFTPESVVGTIRVLRALRAHLTGNARWVPQRAVEEESLHCNPFVFALKYLWQYVVFAVICGLVVVNFVPEAIFIMIMLGTLLSLPLYSGFTALPGKTEEEVAKTGNPHRALFPYFTLWNLLAVTALVLSVVNVNWDTTPLELGVVVVVIQAVLHWSVLEIPLQTVATFFHKPRALPRADASHLSLVLNYNLLATSAEDVDDCMANMYEAYVGNLGENVSAVLVSATNDVELKQYELKVRDDCRARIRKLLHDEGLCWAGVTTGHVDLQRHEKIWSKNTGMDRHTFVDVELDKICERYALEFMVLHRVSRVLRKCGQYQDLMLLSAGEEHAYTYCDAALYGSLARTPGEPLFHTSDDTSRVTARGFDYTLVLDADTRLEAGSAFDMLGVAAAHPNRALIQPSIKMDVGKGDPLFMVMDGVRQAINEPATGALTSILGKSGFYGKGLIKNSAYIEKCVGTRENLIEIVPIDVLSHDTFEAAVLEPMYGNDLYLLEAPCGNYVTWDIRERRWNRGEILLGMYFFPMLMGHPLRWAQILFQGKSFNRTRVRTKCQLDSISSYIAHAALRQMALKPALVAYVVLVDFIDMHYEWAPILTVMFLIIVFPKAAIINASNWRVCLIETVASFLQFTPESVVGTIRVLRALKAHVTGNAMWVPQRAVEDEFKKCNPFMFSLRYLWHYLAFALVCGVIVMSLVPQAVFMMILLGTLFQLPLYAGFTSLSFGKREGEQDAATFAYRRWWNALCAAAAVVCVLNIRWGAISFPAGFAVASLQFLLLWSVMDGPLRTLAASFEKPARLKRARGRGLKCAINYNISAATKDDVDLCMHNMFEAYMGNVEADVFAVLVSATEDETLRSHEVKLRDLYRARIYTQLSAEGRSWAGLDHGEVSARRRDRIWSHYDSLDRTEFVNSHLDTLCAQLADQFLVLHRSSRVLGRCGHYQDLMLLSAGEANAFTYCDASIYGAMAREEGEPLFHASDDVDRVRGCGFGCTLVLDADASLASGAVQDLVEIAAAHPGRAIIQPALTKVMPADGTVFMQMDVLRQRTQAPLDRAVAAALGECEFQGQGLIVNELYLEQCVGGREALVEAVPISALKPGAFESAATCPLYAWEVSISRPACRSYPAWDAQEKHQCLTELSMCVHFFPRFMAPVIWLLGSPEIAVASRTPFRPPSVPYHIAITPLRNIAAKPLLVLYFLMLNWIKADFQRAPFVLLLLACHVLPKLAACKTVQLTAGLAELAASCALLVPEAVVGTTHIFSVMTASCAPAPTWKPSSRALEEELQKTGPLAFSFRHLAKYLPLALACAILAASRTDKSCHAMIMAGTVMLALPLFAGFTASTSSTKIPALKDWHGPDSALVAISQPAPGLERQQERQRLAREVPLGVRLTPSECARIALARAAYCRDAELVLLDDPLGLVDASTGEHILHSLICGRMLEGKTRIVTMQPRAEQLVHFDRVVVFSQGRMVAQGTPQEIMSAPEYVGIAQDGAPSRVPCAATGTTPSTVKIARSPAPVEMPSSAATGTLVETLRAGGLDKFVMSLLLAALLRVASQGQIIILGHWADHKQALMWTSDEQVLKTMGILLVSTCVIQVLQGYMVHSFNIASSKALFARAFATVLKAPLGEFWAKQHAGRVINRLSGDILTIDLAISTSFAAVIGFSFSVLVQQLYCSLVMPWWLVLPLYAAIAVFIRQFCLASMPLHHTSAAALSRCQELHAQAVSAGVSPHAYQHSNSQVAHYCSHLSRIVRPQFLGVSCAKQWLSLRLAVCFCFQSTLCVLLGVLSPPTMGLGSLAVIVASTFAIMQELDTFVDTIANGMAMAVALDRLSEYFQSDAAEEKPADSGIDGALKLGMLTAGGVRVQVEDFTESHDERLRGVSLDVPPRSRLCLLGDSCSSSTVLRLLAVPQTAAEGTILVNSMDARLIDAKTFRTAVAYIPQQPVVLRGSLRSVVDASGSLPDARVWRALEAVGLAQRVRSLAGGLEHPLAEGNGASGSLASVFGEAGLSFGERQQLCLARVVAQQPALLLLDNALSALDPHSRDGVLRSIMSELPHTTIIGAFADPSSVSTFGSVAIFRDGAVVEQGDVAKVFGAEAKAEPASQA